ncbi:hypothetical protein GWK63_09310 [Komagataeibacter rhaeticus]|uniref:Uncharacterized protein n=1 Tax=Komagataeibacter rhaeticus TaxID=215221 RepID=A0A858JF01_9PROT|nr:hypothetical protein GWK63_09310 [Komagataeibacter rhaeticus]
MKYAKDCPTPHRHGSRTKLRLFPSRLVWFWARVSLIDIGQFNDAFVSGLLNGSGTASDLGAIVPTGWRDMQGLQVAWLCAIPLAPQSMSKRLKRDHAMPRFTGRLGELDVIVGQDV